MEIYTDGGCKGNPGPGGWAFVMVDNGKKIAEQSGGELQTTNNRMELLAVISALEICGTMRLNNEISVITDSQYVKNGITQWIHSWKAKGWKTTDRKPVKNQDLWERLDKLAAESSPKWTWVRGHAGNLWNEYCDSQVQKAIAGLEAK